MFIELNKTTVVALHASATHPPIKAAAGKDFAQIKSGPCKILEMKRWFDTMSYVLCFLKVRPAISGPMLPRNCRLKIKEHSKAFMFELLQASCKMAPFMAQYCFRSFCGLSPARSHISTRLLFQQLCRGGGVGAPVQRMLDLQLMRTKPSGRENLAS